MTDKVFAAGALLVKSKLPTEAARQAFDPTKVLDKNGINDLMVNIIKNGGDQAHETIQDLSHLFFHKATEQGYTTPLSDYVNDSEERTAMLKEYEHKVNEINAKTKDKVDRNRALNELAAQYTPKLHKQNLDYLVGKGSIAAKMARTGARGNPTQLGQGTTSPLMAVDVSGNPIPVPITRSFAEGLSAAEHIAMSYGGRGNTVKTQLSTSLPGAIFKHLTPNLFHEVVTTDDCGTKNGIVVPVEDGKSLIGRFEAGSNHLIDEKYYKDLRSTKNEVKVRNVMTCEAHDGVCQKCYGIGHHGKLIKIGENVGVIASQSVSEVLTQAMLSTKHSGGVAGKKRSVYEDVDNLLHNPENFADKATAAKINGKVSKIEQTSLKDHRVYIGDVEHYVPREQDLLVSEGDSIKQGQAISTGTINPRELVSLRGLGAGRIHLAKALRKAYDRETPLDTRHFDLVAKNLVKYVEVAHPGDTGFMPGQKVDVKYIEKELAENNKLAHLGEAEGKILAEKVLEMTPGTLLDKDHLSELKKHGIEKVRVSSSGLQVKPLVPGLATAKLLDKNWVSRLSFNRLDQSIRDAVVFGDKADIHGTDPIAPYVMGSEFGFGENGKY